MYFYTRKPNVIVGLVLKLHLPLATLSLNMGENSNKWLNLIINFLKSNSVTKLSIHQNLSCYVIPKYIFKYRPCVLWKPHDIVVQSFIHSLHHGNHMVLY